MNTLRDKYEGHAYLAAKYDRQKRLKSKLKRIDEMVMSTQAHHSTPSELLTEQAVGSLLLELSKADKAKALAVIKKLNTIIGTAKKAGLKQLTSAIQTAAGDVEKQGSIGGALKSAIKKKLGIEENPIAKIVTFMSSIEQGFEALPEMVKTYSPDLKDMKIGPDWADQMMKDVKSDIKRKNNLMMAVPDDKKKEFAKALLDSFKPAEDEGGFLKQVFSLFTQGGKIPYIKDTQALVKEIMEAEVDDLQEISKTLAAGTSTADLGRAMKQIAEPTSRTAPSGAPIANQEQLAQTIASRSAKEKGTDPGEAAELAKEQPKKLIQGFVDDIATKSKVDKEKVQKILGVLLKNKKLKGGVAEGRRISLTMDDVVDAQMALLESRGSVRLWASLLVEEAKNIGQLKGVVKAKLKGGKMTVDSVAAAINAEKESYDALADTDKKKFLGQLIGEFRLGSESKDFAKQLIEKLKPGGDEASAGDDKNDKNSAAAEAIKDSNAAAQKAVEDNDNIRFRASLLKNKLKELEAAQKILNAAKREDGYDDVKTNLEKAVEYLNKKIKGDDALKDEADVLKTLGSSDRALLKLEKFLREADRKSASREDSAKSKQLQALQGRLKAAAEESKKAIEQAGNEKGELEGKLKGKEDEIAKLKDGLRENEKALDALAAKLKIDPKKLRAAADSDQELEAFVTSLFEKKPEVAAAAVKAVEGAPSSGGKHDKLLQSIKDDIAGLEAGDVSAVLDAIPSWMLAESRRRNTLAERVKLRRRDVM